MEIEEARLLAKIFTPLNLQLDDLRRSYRGFMSNCIYKKDKIDLAHENLHHIMQANYSAEATFPYWETLYALVIGQLLIAYGTQSSRHVKLFFAVCGAFLSIFWLILVSINYLHSKYRAENINTIEKFLNKSYKEHDPDLKYEIDSKEIFFIPEDVSDEDKKTWGWKEIFLGRKGKTEENSRKLILRSTWFYRKLLPGSTLFIFIILFALAIEDP